MKQGYKLVIAVGILFLLVGLNIIFLKLTKSIFDHTKNKIKTAKESIDVLSKNQENITQVNTTINANQSINVEGKNNTLDKEEINPDTIQTAMNQSNIDIQENNNNVTNKTIDTNIELNLTQNASNDKEFLSDMSKIQKMTEDEENKLKNISEDGSKNISNVIVNNIDEKQNKTEVVNNVNNITSSKYTVKLDETAYKASIGIEKTKKSGSRIMMLLVCDVILIAAAIFLFQLYKNYKKYDFLNHNFDDGYTLIPDHPKNI